MRSTSSMSGMPYYDPPSDIIQYLLYRINSLCDMACVKVLRYLQEVQRYSLKVHTILLFQSPYDGSITPELASALSLNTALDIDSTPSIDGMCEPISNIYGPSHPLTLRVKEAIKNSWQLLESGIVFMNSLVTPVRKDDRVDDVLSHLVVALMSKFIVSILPETSGSSIRIWTFGKIARGAIADILKVMDAPRYCSV